MMNVWGTPNQGNVLTFCTPARCWTGFAIRQNTDITNTGFHIRRCKSCIIFLSRFFCSHNLLGNIVEGTTNIFFIFSTHRWTIAIAGVNKNRKLVAFAQRGNRPHVIVYDLEARKRAAVLRCAEFVSGTN